MLIRFLDVHWPDYFTAHPSQTRYAVDVANTDDRCTGSQGLGCRRAGGGVGAGLRKVIHPIDHGLRTVRSPLATTPTLATTLSIIGFVFLLAGRGSCLRSWI